MGRPRPGLRVVVYPAAEDGANLAAVLEKSGLLIPQNPVDEDRPPDPSDPTSSPSSSGRRMGPSGPVAARRHQISPSAVPFSWALLSLIRRILLASLLRRKPTRTRSSVRPRNAPRPASPSAHWSSRLWEAGGPMLFVAWIASESRRPGPSTALTPASRLRSASRAPFREKTREQS